MRKKSIIRLFFLLGLMFLVLTGCKGKSVANENI